MEQLALDEARVLHADEDVREHVLENARRGEEIGGPDLAQIGHHRFARFRAIRAKAGHVTLRIGEDVIPDPGHGQIGEDLVVLVEPVELRSAARRGQ